MFNANSRLYDVLYTLHSQFHPPTPAVFLEISITLQWLLTYFTVEVSVHTFLWHGRSTSVDWGFGGFGDFWQ